MGNIQPSALRQPPPPGRRLLIPSPTTSKAQGDISWVRSRPFYFRKCIKANPSNSMINSLPDELLIEILLRLSADDIYDNKRLVCRQWRHLIQTDAFVREHLHRARSGLLLQPLFDGGRSPIFVTATMQGRVQISRLSRRIKFPIVCSCNGLALCLREDEYGRKAPFILNPATNCAFDLPRFPVKERVGKLLYGLGMVYCADSMAYKCWAQFPL